jgi:hypothetical protein
LVDVPELSDVLEVPDDALEVPDDILEANVSSVEVKE